MISSGVKPTALRTCTYFNIQNKARQSPRCQPKTVAWRGHPIQSETKPSVSTKDRGVAWPSDTKRDKALGVTKDRGVAWPSDTKQDKALGVNQRPWRGVAIRYKARQSPRCQLKTVAWRGVAWAIAILQAHVATCGPLVRVPVDSQIDQFEQTFLLTLCIAIVLEECTRGVKLHHKIGDANYYIVNK